LYVNMFTVNLILRVKECCA